MLSVAIRKRRQRNDRLLAERIEMRRAFAQITLAVLVLIAMLSLGILLSCQHEPNGRNEEAGPGALFQPKGPYAKSEIPLMAIAL